MFTHFKFKAFAIVLLMIMVTLFSFLSAPGTLLAAGKPPTATPTSGGGPTTTPAPTNTPSSGAHTYYVDCSAATNGNGTQTSPWNSVASPNATTFGPGDQLLFKRGATCNSGVGL